MVRRRVAVLAGALCLAGVACSGDDAGGTATTGGSTSIGSATTGVGTATSGPLGTAAPQPLTIEQAELLARMRVANYRAIESSFTTSVSDEGEVIDLHGVVNWSQHTGSAVFRSAGRTDANGHGLMQWNFDKVAAHAGGDADGPPPAPPEDGTWLQRPIDPTTSSIDAVFLLLLSVAAPEPDNPQLLQQTDAVYLGTEIIAGQTATVFGGPSSDEAADPTATTSSAAGTAREQASSLTYWVAADGKLLRLRAAVGNQTVNVDFSAAPATPTAYLPDLITPS